MAFLSILLAERLAIAFKLQHIGDEIIPTLATIVVIPYPLLPVLPDSLARLELGPPYLRLKPSLLLMRPFR